MVIAATKLKTESCRREQQMARHALPCRRDSEEGRDSIGFHPFLCPSGDIIKCRT